ncbi:MAG: alanine dehydrogenase [Phycisphaeraceae bacterium]|jgi:alanine dehydrogenase
MIIGVPKEIKSDEYRVSMLPVGVEELTKRGHTVLVENSAGIGSGYEDERYTKAGGTLIDSAEEIFAKSDMIVKVKEPQPSETVMMRDGQVVFTYFHFAADEQLSKGCLESGASCVAYETLVDRQGRLPLLTPMSEVAGRMAIQEGAKYLEKPQEGRGILLGGVPGVEPAKVLILGGGVVGTQAAIVAAGMGADVTIMDVNLDRLRYLDEIMPANVTTIYSDLHAIREHAVMSDLVVGAVLIPGGRTPVLINREMLKDMLPGSVIIDVGVDQGGCIETTRPTTHAEPIYIIDEVVHYCVANMPGAVGRTSTQALCHATQPYAIELAEALGGDGLEALVRSRADFNSALNMHAGKVTHEEVAHAIGVDCDDSLRLTDRRA